MNGSQIVVGVEGAQAIAEFQRIVTASVKAGDSIEDAFRKGATALDKFDTTTERSSKRQERQARNLENQIKRQVAATQAGGRGTADYYEAMARASGTYTKAVEAQVASLRKLEAQQRKTSSGISAGQHAAAMRMLPAQMTDIGVGLATGQSPFMVMMQQGGQLKDMFGGIVPAAKAVGGSILSFVANPMTLAAGAVLGLGTALYKGAQEARQFQNAVTLAGARSGVTADTLMTLTHTVGSATGSISLAKDALLEMAKSGAIAAGDYERMSAAIVMQSRATGQSVADLVREYSKIAEDPVKAVVELSGKYRIMTADVYAQVKALQDQGKHQEAVRLVQSKYADESESMARRVTENLGLIEAGWQGIRNRANEAWEAIKRFGRDATLGERMAELQAQIAGMERVADNLGTRESLANNERYNKLLADRAELQKRIAGQQVQAALDQQAAEAQKAGVTAQDWLAKEALSAASEREKHESRLAEIERNRQAALKSATTEMAKQLAIRNADKARAAEVLAYEERQAKAKAQSAREAAKEQATFLHPLNGTFKSKSGPGMRDHPVYGGRSMHYGRDYSTPIGTPTRAMADGTVMAAGRAGGAGIQLVIKYDDGSISKYFHLSKILDGLRAGARVGRGQTVALSGNTGVGTAAHSHFEVYDPSGKLQDVKDVAGAKTGKPQSFSDTAYGKVMEAHERAMIGLRAQNKALLDGTTESQKNYIALISSAEYQNMPADQQAEAVAWARTRDEIENNNKQIAERIENERKYREAVAQTTEAMVQQLALAQQQYQRDLSGMGKGAQWREQEAARQQIDDRYQSERNKYSKMLIGGSITQAQYDGALKVVEQANQNELAMHAQFVSDKLALQGSWEVGALESLNNYRDAVANVAQSTEQMFTNAFKGMEDAIVSFVKTGKLDFRSLADSIISDMIRIAVQQSITGPLASWMGGLIGGAAGASAGPGPFFGNALGGVYNSPGLSAYSGQIVSKPTLFPFAKGTGLMGEAGPEAILPLKRGPGGYLGVRAEGGGGSPTINITINSEGGAQTSTSAGAGAELQQFAKRISGLVQAELDREMRPGGKLVRA